MKTCKIRQDLINNGLSVPVGNDYLSTTKELSYKWMFGNFYILHDNKYKLAYSIDFEF